MESYSNSQDNAQVFSRQAKKYFEANRNALVIEDDKIMGQMVAEILDDAGFEVTTATNGVIAFDRLEERTIDFIVLDILLPEMNGFEIYTELQTESETENIPVLIITAWADERHLERASQLGIRHFLAKPFTEDELLYEIFSLLRDSSDKKE